MPGLRERRAAARSPTVGAGASSPAKPVMIPISSKPMSFCSPQPETVPAPFGRALLRTIAPRRTPQSEASFARLGAATRYLTGDHRIGDQGIAVDKHAAGAIHDCVSPSSFGEQNFYAKPG